MKNLIIYFTGIELINDRFGGECDQTLHENVLVLKF